jgi:hypothetical protein
MKAMQKTIKKTETYTIVQKRNGRYGVKSANGKWINAADKVDILTKEKMITLPKSKPKAAPEAEESAEAAE